MQLRVLDFEITWYLKLFWESRKWHELKVLAVAVNLGHDTHFMHLIKINLKVSHYEKEGRLTMLNLRLLRKIFVSDRGLENIP